MNEQLTATDLTHRDMLRATCAMIDARWPGRYDDLIGRLEALTRLITRTSVREICELPHLSIDEEDECDRQRNAQEGN